MAYIGKTPTPTPLTSSDIANDIINSDHIGDTAISGFSALTSAPADTDEFLISDAGTIKRIDASLVGGGIDGWSSSSNNLLPDSASSGIYLGVNSATASNLLNDYEEGTWTPSYTGSTTGSISYGSRGGTYTKVGNLVVAYFALVNFTATGTWAGDIKVTGLPFTCNQTNNVRVCNGVCRFYNINTGGNSRYNVTMDVDSGQSYLIFLESGDDTNWTSIATETTSTSYLEGTISYRTDS